MGIVRMIVVGLIVGILARFFYPGAVPLNWLWSIVLGIAGSFLAGLIAQLISPKQGQQPLHPAGFLASILGAMLLIFLARTFHILL
jgi:uncharacterized membrane protein YeaQ/YmgE (transglycosylase-associated protein family)